MMDIATALELLTDLIENSDQDDDTKYDLHEFLNDVEDGFIQSGVL